MKVIFYSRFLSLSRLLDFNELSHECSPECAEEMWRRRSVVQAKQEREMLSKLVF